MIATNIFGSKEVYPVPPWLKAEFQEAIYYADIDGNRLILTDCNYQKMSEVPVCHRYMHYDISGVIYSSFWTSIEAGPEDEPRQMDIFDFI